MLFDLSTLIIAVLYPVTNYHKLPRVNIPKLTLIKGEKTPPQLTGGNPFLTFKLSRAATTVQGATDSGPYSDRKEKKTTLKITIKCVATL